MTGTWNACTKLPYTSGLLQQGLMGYGGDKIVPVGGWEVDMTVVGGRVQAGDQFVVTPVDDGKKGTGSGRWSEVSVKEKVKN